MSDELDRLFGRLVEALAESGPGRLAVPFACAELFERLVPYRSNRARLNVATHEDYEMTVLRLLAGERGYATIEPATVQQALQREANAPHGDTGLFRNFPDALIMVNRIAAERFLKGDKSFAPPEAGALVESAAPPPNRAQEPAQDSHFALDEGEDAAHQCAYCGGTLPGRHKVNFCPHCGQPPSGELRCPACGSEVDVGWAYCASCGRSTGFE